MLVLSRKPGEWIDVGDNLRLCVVDVRDGRVRIGFEAPRSVPIVRSELLAHGSLEHTQAEGANHAH